MGAEILILTEGLKQIKESIRIIEGEKTAEEARINASSQTSALDMVVSLWDSVVNAALKACAEYKAVDPELVSYTMNRDYYDTTLSAQEAGAIVTIKDSGAIAVKDMR